MTFTGSGGMLGGAGSGFTPTSRLNTIYVGKHGDDSNTGLTPDTAKLTFTAGIAAATALTPSSSNRVAIYCEDGGNYAESLAVPSWCGIVAPSALIDGNHTLSDNSLINAFRLTASSGVAVTKSAGTGQGVVYCPRMVLSGAAGGVVCTSGTITYTGESIELANGFGIGNLSTDAIRASVSFITITGTGIGIGISSTGRLAFEGNEIACAGAGTGIYVASTGEVDAQISRVDCATAYNVAAAGAALHLVASHLSGTQTNIGTVNYVSTDGGAAMFGSVGINATTPLAELHVAGKARVGLDGDVSAVGQLELSFTGSDSLIETLFGDMILKTPAGKGVIIGSNPTTLGKAPLHVGDSNVNNSVDCQVLVSRNVDNGTAGNGHCFSDSSTINRAGKIAYNSMDARFRVQGTDDYDHFALFQDLGIVETTGTTDHYWALVSQTQVDNGTVLERFGLEFRDFLGTGAVTTQAAVYVKELLKATNNYAVLTEGATKSSFGGRVGFGTTSPDGVIDTTPDTIGTDSYAYPIPRMTTAQRLALTGMTTGAKVFDTDLEEEYTWRFGRWVDNLKSESWFIPMSGVTDNTFNIAGQERLIVAGQTTDYTTDFGLQNQHLSIIVNAITTGGDIVITGTSVSESTAVPVAADTETITVDTTVGQGYQSTKKWLEITNIDVTGGAITGINYDVNTLGYLDFGNTSWRILGYRVDIKTDSALSDLGLVIEKVKDDGSGKYSIVTLEDYGHDSTVAGGSYIDDLRTGGSDRDYTMGSNLAPVDSGITYKMGDFDTYFTSDENMLDGALDEGVILRFEGKPTGGISGIDHATVTLYYTN